MSPLKAALCARVFALRAAWYRLRYPNLTIGADPVIIGRLTIRRGTRVVLGDRVRIRNHVSITGKGTVTVGSDTLLNGCWIVCAERVDIADHCLIADCGICDNDFHNLRPDLRHEPPRSTTHAPVVVGRNVWIGLGALLLKGVRVGDDSVVGAAAVVRSDVPARCVVSGNPATVVKRFDADQAALSSTGHAPARPFTPDRQGAPFLGVAANDVEWPK